MMPALLFHEFRMHGHVLDFAHSLAAGAVGEAGCKYGPNRKLPHGVAAETGHCPVVFGFFPSNSLRLWDSLISRVFTLR